MLIAARPDQAEVKAASAARQLDYPVEKLEILLARGRQPSAQRNEGLKAARGDLVYFLDDDSIPHPQTLRKAVAHFVDPLVQVVGGPNVCPEAAPALEQVFAAVLSSWLAFGPSRARYARVGRVRDTTEKELILCNLVGRRQGFLDAGGFDEALYPNEENALMDKLLDRKGRLLYDPEVVVERRPRRTAKAFVRMLMTYGRGRAEQFRRHPTPGSALNFVPPVFVWYLALLPVLVWWQGVWTLGPLALYALVVLGQGAWLVWSQGLMRGLGAVPFIVMTHVLYGLGFWRGIFTRLAEPGSASRPGGGEAVRLEAVPIERV